VRYVSLKNISFSKTSRKQSKASGGKFCMGVRGCVQHANQVVSLLLVSELNQIDLRDVQVWPIRRKICRKKTRSACASSLELAARQGFARARICACRQAVVVSLQARNEQRRAV
jgi:hypothetical protein